MKRLEWVLSTFTGGTTVPAPILITQCVRSATTGESLLAEGGERRESAPYT